MSMLPKFCVMALWENGLLCSALVITAVSVQESDPHHALWYFKRHVIRGFHIKFSSQFQLTRTGWSDSIVGDIYLMWLTQRQLPVLYTGPTIASHDPWAPLGVPPKPMKTFSVLNWTFWESNMARELPFGPSECHLVWGLVSLFSHVTSLHRHRMKMLADRCDNSRDR